MLCANPNLYNSCAKHATWHHAWAKDVLAMAGAPDEKLAFPIIAHPERGSELDLRMVDPLESSPDEFPMPAVSMFHCLSQFCF